jgi:hypothetical protein
MVCDILSCRRDVSRLKNLFESTDLWLHWTNQKGDNVDEYHESAMRRHLMGSMRDD